MKRMCDSWRVVYATLLLFFLTVAVSGCTVAHDRLWLKAPGWGRATYVADTAINDPITIAIDEQGSVYLLVVDRLGELYHPRVIQLDRQIEKTWEQTFDIELTAIDEPRLLYDGAVLQVFWISRNKLYHSQVNPSGEVINNPVIISGDILVDAYDVEFDSESGLTVWFAGTERVPGLYALPPGNLEGQPAQVDPLGLSPDIQYDKNGVLHTTWWHDDKVGGDNRVFYGAYDGAEFHSGQEIVIYDIHLKPSDGFEGPRFGIDQTHAYIFWTLFVRTGLRSGTIEANYVHFPLGEPRNVAPRQVIVMPVDYDLDYLSFEGYELDVGKRVPVQQEMRGGTSVITDIAIQPNVGQELALAVRIRGSYLMRKEEYQISMVFLTQGNSSSYQLLSFTATDSTSPFIISDSEGFLYLSWLEEVLERGRAVYFASTAPDIRASIRSLTLDDIQSLAVEILFGMLMGILMAPFAMVWVIAPLILLGLTSRIRREDEGLTEKGTVISLVLALLAYWAGKTIILPTMWEYVPFSSWVPFIPEVLETPLRFLMPILIAILSLLFAWNYTYRRERNSVLFFILLYAVVDAILTMAIYGVLILGAI